jgi:hypothetical protein
MLIRPNSPGFIGFQTIFLFFQQNRKFKVVYILAYLPRLDKAVRPSGKFDRVSGNSMDHFQVGN